MNIDIQSKITSVNTSSTTSSKTQKESDVKFSDELNKMSKSEKDSKADESKKVIELLLDEQDKTLQADIKKKTEQLEKIKNIRNFLTSFKDGSQKTIHVISSIMEEKEKRKKMYKKMLIVGIPVEITGIVTFVIGILQGIWIPFFVTTAVYTICAVFLANYWYKRIEYICPECHTRFQPRKMETLLANHNPKMRKLTCPSCRRKIWSLEVYRKEVDA